MRAGRERAARAGSSVDPVDLARFDRLGAQWWDADGPMRMLHVINPVRIAYIRDMLVRHCGRSASTRNADPALPLDGIRLLDIGCGGGVLSEPLARLGAVVTGIDPAEGNIAAARQHAEATGLAIDYRATTVEALAAGEERFDAVLAMEVVEHVVDPRSFLASVCSLVAPGGALVGSTLNRTAKSFALAIVGAEYVLRWLPRGTHAWSQFVTPEEFRGAIRRTGLTTVDTTGLVYDPLRATWHLSPDTDVNYFVTAGRPAVSGAAA